RDIGSAERNRQKWQDWRCNAEAARVVGYRWHSDALGQFHCRNIARLSYRVAKGDVAFKLAIEVARRIGNAGAVERGRRVQDQVVRLCALIYGCGVDERLKGRSSLARSLRRTVEF